MAALFMIATEVSVKPRKILLVDGHQNSDYFGEGVGNDKKGHEESFCGAGNFLYVVLSDGYARAFT